MHKSHNLRYELTLVLGIDQEQWYHVNSKPKAHAGKNTGGGVIRFCIYFTYLFLFICQKWQKSVFCISNKCEAFF